MENLGEKFRQTRIAKRITIEQAAEETCIPKSSLEAMENEDYSQFPAEIFLTGFIRNYAIYLGLNPNEMIALYRSRLIQEQPIPVEQLLSLEKKISVKKIFPIVVILIVIAVLIAAAAYFFIFSESDELKPVVETAAVSNLPLFDGQFIEQKMKADDKIRIPVGEDEFILTVKEIGGNVLFEYESGAEKTLVETNIPINEEKLIDFNSDGIADVKISTKEFDSVSQTALIRISREVGEAVLSSDANPQPSVSPESEFIDIPTDVEISAPESRRVESIIVETSSVANPFSIDIVFRDRCFVRYKLDTEDDFVEGFFRNNQRLKLDGNMRIYLSLSNAGVASVKVNGTDVQLGTLGQVVSREAQWAFNHQRNLYELRIIPRY